MGSKNSSILTRSAIEKEEAFLKEPTAENAISYLGWIQHLGTDFHVPKDNSVGRALDVLVRQFESRKIPSTSSRSEITSSYTFYRDVAVMFKLTDKIRYYESKLRT